MTDFDGNLLLTCPACKAESNHPLNFDKDHFVGPVTIMRVRSTGGERSRSMIPVTCPACGLVSLFDGPRTMELHPPPHPLS